jgi:hypothetical protein
MTITLDARPTPSGKLALKATDASGLSTKTKYVVGGYRFYVVSARASKWTWEGGEPFLKDSLSVTVDKRTGSKETAMREFKKGGPNTAVLWKAPDGSFVLAARGRGIAAPE